MTNAEKIIRHSSSMYLTSTQTASPWPHRWAIALACATFPLLWVGGLVTTTKAGMAVPDWPNTYGYNLFLYPWSTWIAGPWDIFVEHGHRLIAATVGMITIGLTIVLWRGENRRWVRGLGIAALALVITQGIMGGLRVLWDERTLAMFHGVTGPVFFSLAVALAVFTSKRWMSGATGSVTVLANAKSNAGAGAIRALATVTCILVYLQIVVGAVLRHIPIGADPSTFALAVRFHLFLAAVLALHVALLVYLVLRCVRSVRPLAGLALTLAVLLLVQLSLGAGTWIVKYAIHAWAADWLPPMTTAIQDGGAMQTHIITAHVAVGSLLLATALALALYAHRFLTTRNAKRSVVLGPLEAAV
ncbi:MAG: COX15/CtaA family protein [Pirellulales bacterium]